MFGTLACITEQFGKNFGLNTLQNRECSSCNNLHAYFAKNASLNKDKSLKPIPPCVFGLHSSCHLIQWILQLSPLCPQKNFRISASISWHRVPDSLKHDIVYVGSAWATALIKTSRPICDKSLPFQPCNLFLLYLCKAVLLASTNKIW